jgi:hypothetical protein
MVTVVPAAFDENQLTLRGSDRRIVLAPPGIAHASPASPRTGPNTTNTINTEIVFPYKLKGGGECLWATEDHNIRAATDTASVESLEYSTKVANACHWSEVASMGRWGSA